jgi:hypothetical protein
MAQQIASKKDPSKIWIQTVDSRHRIRLGKHAAEHLPWLKASEGFGIDFVSRVGPTGQLHLSLKDREETLLQKVKASLDASPVGSDIIDPRIDVLRYEATKWVIPCTFEAKSTRFTLVLPREARDLGLVPNENGIAVIFSTGDILEIWPAGKWVEHVTKISANLSHFTALALDEIESRGLE